MSLVLTENEATESGIAYDDRTGVSYQFPAQYRNMIQPGERFVYYRGRKKRGGGRMPQVYFGVGVVGHVRSDDRHPGRYTCDVLDYQPFAVPVPFRRQDGDYLESSAKRGYFQRGV
ncbi:unnamed protein product, partial [marine sediment metagenome]